MLEQLIDALREAMQSQLVGGGLVLMGVGAAMGLCRSVPRRLWALLERQFSVVLDVQGREAPYEWLTTWYSMRPEAKRARSVSVTAFDATPDSDATEMQARFAPAPGLHYLWYRKRPVIWRRLRSEPQAGQNGPIESLELRVFGRSPKILHELVAEAKKAAARVDGRITIYLSRRDYWRRAGSIEARPLSSVMLPDGIAEKIAADMTAFMESRSWYVERGIPWRRGYLLHGLPGTGKSSLVGALAGHLGLNVYVLNLASAAMSDEDLTELLGNVPRGAIVLLEDVDAVVSGRDIKTGESAVAATVTFSGLLNSLDGVGAGEGRLLVMTTNHVEKLDAALIRPGRVDMRVQFGAAARPEIERMFCHFYAVGHAAEDVAQAARKFSAAVSEKGAVMADIQSLLLEYKDNPVAAVEAVDARRVGGPGAA